MGWEPHTHIVGPGTVDLWKELREENAALRSRIEMHEIHINLMETRLKDAEELIWQAEHGRGFTFRMKLKEYRAKYGEVE